MDDIAARLEALANVPIEPNPARVATWTSLETGLHGVTDKLGKPIDAGIFQTIVGLNALGVSTEASCEGHLDYGLAYPWVALESRNSPAFQAASEKYWPARDEMDRLYEAGQVKTDDFGVIAHEAHALQAEMERALALELERIRRLLGEFYTADRLAKTPYDQILTVDRDRIQPIGGDAQIIAGDSAATNLARYQREMSDFATFLKGKFVTS